MERDSVLDRVLGSRLTTAVAARPRAALTVGMLTLLLLAGDPASAETLDAGTTSPAYSLPASDSMSKALTP